MSMTMITTITTTTTTRESRSTPDVPAARGAGQKSFPGVTFSQRKAGTPFTMRVYVPQAFFSVLPTIRVLTSAVPRRCASKGGATGLPDKGDSPCFSHLQKRKIGTVPI